MKPFIPYSLLAAFAACGLASAQTATTTPVGYYSFDGKAGGNLFVPGLVNSPVFAGAITAATDNDPAADTLTVATGVLTAGAFDAGAVYPTHYVEITQAGSNQGVVIDIESNTSSVITLVADISALALTGTETIVVRPHVTLAEVFADAEDELAAFGDSATFFEATGEATSYFYTESGVWTTDFENPDGSARPIPPGSGFVLDLGSDKGLVIAGEVKSSATVVQFNAGTVNILGPVNPLVGDSEQLANLGFVNIEPFADSMTLFTPGNLVTPIGSFFSDGTNMTEDFENPSSVAIPFTTGGVFQAGTAGSIRIQSGL
jgi:hypothetical protein